MADRSPALDNTGLAFDWKDHSRFVEVVPVQTGWLVVWGHYEDLGARKYNHGSRVYRDLPSVRRRIADVVKEFTRKESEARDALTQFDLKRIEERTFPALR